MSQPSFTDCCSPGAEGSTVQVPGPQGDPGNDGTNGMDGVNPFTALTAGFTVPAIAATVVIAVGNSDWMVAGEKLYIGGAGYYDFVSATASTNATVRNLGYSGNAAPTTIIAPTQKVSPGGIKGADGADGADGLDATTPLTTKGDILTRTSSNVRLGIGADGTRLMASAAEATGMKYAKVDVADTTQVTGTLAITHGGTGQVSANLAFNALSPLTTRGDIVYRNATINARLPLGTLGQLLKSNGTDPVYGKLVPGDVDMSVGPLPRYGLLASLTGADFNSTLDQPITLQPGVARYIIRRIIVDNASVSLTTAAGGIYVGAAKSAPIIVAAAQVYTALNATTKFLDLTLEAVVGTDILTALTLYLSLTTPQGGAGTANVWIFGENLTP